MEDAIRSARRGDPGTGIAVFDRDPGVANGQT
jgi:hypothetical protein